MEHGLMYHQILKLILLLEKWYAYGKEIHIQRLRLNLAATHDED